MDILRDHNIPIAGPHLFKIMKRGNVTVYAIGEEHSTQNMCWQDGADIGDVIKEAVCEDGAFVYLEMPLSYEQNTNQNLKCTPKPESGPRLDVLNMMRTCLLAFRNRNSALRKRIHFTDVRESFKLLPYTERENSCVQEVKDDIARQGVAELKMKKHFVDPLFKVVKNISMPDEEFRSLILDDDRVVETEWEAFICQQWFARAHGQLMKTIDNFYKFEKISNKSVTLRERSIDRVIDPYRSTLDACTDVYTVYRILKDVYNSNAKDCICYSGSSHSVQICDILAEFGFEKVFEEKNSVHLSCVRKNFRIK